MIDSQFDSKLVRDFSRMVLAPVQSISVTNEEDGFLSTELPHAGTEVQQLWCEVDMKCPEPLLR